MKKTFSLLGILILVSSCGIINSDKQAVEKVQDQTMTTEFKVTEDLVDKTDEALSVTPPPADIIMGESPAAPAPVAAVEPQPEPAKEVVKVAAIVEPPKEELKVAEAPKEELKIVDVAPPTAPVIQEEMRAPVEPRQEDFQKNKNFVEAPKTQEFSTYKLAKNETLMMAAFRIYGDYMKWKDLKTWNQAEIKKGLHAGMSLKYFTPEKKFVWEPSGLPYLVKTKDTLGTISMDKYKTPKKWKNIYENNRPLIRNPNVIFAGFTIYYLPDRGIASEKK